MKLHKCILMITMWASLGAATCLTQEGTALARSVPAFIGSARYGSEAHCFYEGHGGPHQLNCSNGADNKGPQWVIPLVTDAPKKHTIYVTARGSKSGSNNVNCRAYSLSQTGAITIGGSAGTVLNTGGLETLQMTLQVQSWGAAWVTCSMAQGTRIYNANYTW